MKITNYWANIDLICTCFEFPLVDVEKLVYKVNTMRVININELVIFTCEPCDILMTTYLVLTKINILKNFNYTYTLKSLGIDISEDIYYVFKALEKNLQIEIENNASAFVNTAEVYYLQYKDTELFKIEIDGK